jgi:hypothetical protein
MSQDKQDKSVPPADANFVEVAVVTTSGSYPHSGFERTPIHQKISVILKKAARELHISDTSDWVATIDDQEIDPAKTYLELNLHGQVEIDYGPREGGGGRA